MRLDDRLGHLVPPGRIRRPQLEQGLVAAMEQRRLTTTPDDASVPTRYVVAMHPADLAWLDPHLPDLLGRALKSHASKLGALQIGKVEVSFRSDARLGQGRPQFWVGFADHDLLVLANAGVAAEVAASQR